MNGSLAIAALPLLAMAASASGLGPPKDIWDPKVQAGLFTGRVLACPAPYEVTVAAWEFDGEGTWPLAAVDANAKGLRVENGVLRCAASAAKLELGWGNWERGAARALKTISFRGNQIAGAVIQARVRQSKPKATWRFQFRHRGDPNDTGAWGTAQGWGPPKLEAASNPQSTDWQVLSVACKQLAEADGFGVEIQGEPGNEIEIDHIRIVQEVWDIHARKVVTIPPGRIFSAVATVSINLDVWVNGTQIREDEVCGSMARYQHVAVDLKPHLKPGRNVICLREFMRMKHTPICWLQGAVQMVSGETIPVETGLDWKTSVKEEPGWLTADFDDSKWLVPGKEDPTRYLRDMRPYTVYHPGRLPAYCGQVALENPYQQKLFYDESKPVKFRV
ncbi:MAG: hypothetical protein FJ279_37590, partial [Planctomycetes bacterium]|nr:hypothetical protein [Planctomycetota bacterium]